MPRLQPFAGSSSLGTNSGRGLPAQGKASQGTLTAIYRLSLAPLLCAVIFLAYLALSLRPVEQELSLPPHLISIEKPEGQSLLSEAHGLGEYASLAAHFEEQVLVTYCGVASGVMVLSSLGLDVSQADFFLKGETALHDWQGTVRRGMSLHDLARHTRRLGGEADLVFAREISVQHLRERVVAALGDQNRHMIVGYSRTQLGQEGAGHMSPIAAYNIESDMVLLMDTAAYNYPMTWIPLDRLYRAMLPDSATGANGRGFIEVSRRAR